MKSRVKPDKYRGMKHAATWLPDDLYKKLKAIASADDRSVAMFMRRLIEKAVNGEPE